MKWSAVFLALVAAGPAAIIADPVTAGARAQADPDPNEVWIGGATYGGTGCPEVRGSTQYPPVKLLLTLYIGVGHDFIGRRQEILHGHYGFLHCRSRPGPES